MIYAVVLIAIIGGSAVGVYFLVQPVTNPYEVAIVFATGGLGDKSFNDGVKTGADLANTDHNINYTYSEPSEISQYETFLRQYASHAGYIEPFALIISVGFDQADAVMAVAEDYPLQKFAIVDMYIDPLNYTNVASLLFSEHEGSALVGAIAGLTTTTDDIAFVGGMDIDLIRKFGAGYEFGANFTNPDVDVTMSYVGDWADVALGKSIADGLFTAGNDIIFAAAGRSGLGVYDSAKELDETATVSNNDLWVIGVDSPQMYLGCDDPDNPVAPTIGLTTMLKRVDVATYNIMVEVVIDDDWQTGFGLLHTFDLSNGGHDYEINTDLLTLDQSIIDIVNDLKAAIVNGSVVVPSNYT